MKQSDLCETIFGSLEDNLKHLVQKIEFEYRYGSFLQLEMPNIMKIRIYNNKFSFEEILDFLVEDEHDFFIKKSWEESEPLNCLISDIPKDHLVYGWYESYVQGQNVLNIDFTHIQFTKELKHFELEGDVSGGTTCFESRVDGVIPVRVSITPPSA